MTVPRRKPRKLVISDTDGTVLGKLVIPDGATQAQIIEAGERARADLLARKRAATAAPTSPPPAAGNGGTMTVPSKPPREILCPSCREPFPEVEYRGRASFANHIETVERPRAEAAHRETLRRS